MDTGKYIAAGLLNFKKGFESLDSVAEIEWKTLHDSKISFFDLKFDINCVKRDLEIKISTLDSRNWLDFKKYFEIMQHPDFFKEQGFSQGFLKEQFDFLENRTYSIKDSQKNCKIKQILLLIIGERLLNLFIIQLLFPAQNINLFLVEVLLHCK